MTPVDPPGNLMQARFGVTDSGSLLLRANLNSLLTSFPPYALAMHPLLRKQRNGFEALTTLRTGLLRFELSQTPLQRRPV